MSRFGLAMIALAAACGHAREQPAMLANHAPGDGPGGLVAGDYACRIDEGGFRYPPFHCVVGARGDRMFLEKVEGSVRFRGTVTRHGDGFAFDGELYCPWGDCTEKVHSVFAADGDGLYHGTVTSLQSGPATVTLRYVPGGYGTGGDGYGGLGYGGDGYGGSGYGGYEDIDP